MTLAKQGFTLWLTDEYIFEFHAFLGVLLQWMQIPCDSLSRLGSRKGKHLFEICIVQYLHDDPDF